ncbi:hypothetical protein BGX21_007858 [Mortierella sp. AD011]|nr:hypothetical protein BGX21_007858 [Mortierella sp. AD011]
MAGWENGTYDIILGVSVDGLYLDHIESVTFKIDGKTRVLNRAEMNALCLEKSLWDDETVKWKLPLQVSKFEEHVVGSKVLDMEITLDNTFQGFLELHFMEFRRFQFKGYPDDAYIRTHPPYIASFDVGHIDGVASGASHDLEKRIIHFAVSGNGKYAVTLSDAKTDLLLELWDIQGATPAPAHPQFYARIPVSIAGALTHFSEGSYNVSVSWDASQIALIDVSKAYQTYEDDNQSLFAVYKHQISSQTATTGLRSSMAISDPALSKDYQLLEGVNKFYGHGKFHIINPNDQNPENERFVACRGASVEVYKVNPTWERIRDIHLLQSCDTSAFCFSSARRLIRTLQGKYFAWTNMGDYAETVSVWDLEKECMTSVHLKKDYNPRIDGNDAIAFSRRGSIMAIGVQKVITTYYAKTGALRGSFNVPACCKTVVDIAFICDDTQMLVIAEKDITTGGTKIGLILDATSMTTVSRFALEYPQKPEQTVIALDNTLVCVLKSSLGFVHLKHKLPHYQTRQVCGDQCKDRLVPLDQQPKELKTPSGMDFKVEIQRNRGSRVVVSTSSNKELTLILPSSGVGHDADEYRCAVFLPDRLRLVVISDTLVTIWSLPETSDDDYTLLLAWNKLKNDGFWDPMCRSWYTCAHSQVNASGQAEDGENNQDKKFCFPRTERAFCHEQSERFLFALKSLIHIYAKGDKICKDAILRYVGSHINNYPDTDDRSKSVLAKICMYWDHNSHNKYEQFLKALLESPFGRWIPLPPRIENDQTEKGWIERGRIEKDGMEKAEIKKDWRMNQTEEDRKSDPLYILMGKADEGKQVIEMAEIIVNYCVRQARIEKDPQFLSPIMHCLPQLCDKDQDLLGFGSRTLRRLAFIPVKNRTLIMDHHTIVAHSPDSRYLYDYVLQLERHRQGGRYDLVNDEFDSDNWAFHTMMIFYFFFTVIIMLNVLAFEHGDETWLAVWHQSRLRFNVLAENASYMPGCRHIFKRRAHKEIYYSATPQQIRTYKKKYFEDEREEHEIANGSQDWHDYIPSKASVTNDVASVSDGPPSPNGNPVISTTILQTTMEEVLKMNNGVIEQLRSIQKQQEQLRKQMERLELELNPSRLQPESNVKRALVQERLVAGAQCFVAETAE